MGGTTTRSAFLLSLAATAITAVAVLGIVAHHSFADATTYPTADDAAQAGFEQFWHPVIGSCNSALSTPAPGEVCFSRQPSDGYYFYYGAPAGYFDLAWWVGVAGVGDGWKVYDSGECDIWYCRVTNPEGLVVSGHPNGDANGDRTTNSLDALLILQHVAGLLPDLHCDFNCNVDGRNGVNAEDATLILQAEVALIPGLPLRHG